jgi:hypothetical protein
MNCGYCNRKVRKEIKIDNILLCHECKKETLKDLGKIYDMKGLKVIAPYINKN